MIRKTIKMLLVILALTFNCFALDGFIEDGWKNIKPLKTDRKTAEKILGSPKTSRDNYYNYETNGFFIQIKYSTASCAENNYEAGYYDVPVDTVISYHVFLDNPIKLTDFKFKREKYKRQPDSERSSLIYYDNSEDAILMSVSILDGIEYVGEIQFYPTEKDKKKFECMSSVSPVDNSIEDGWKNIKPLKTDRTMAERTLNSLKASKNTDSSYQTSEFYIEINYSTAPCKENKDKTGKYNVSENTVLNYDVIFNEAVKIKDFKFKREKYRREKDLTRSDLDLAFYINDDDGVKLYVRVFNEIEYVGRIEFYLSEKDKKKFECKNSKAVIDKTQETKSAEKPKCGEPK